MLNKGFKLAATVVLLTASTTSFAQDKAEEAFSNELVQCAAYYEIASGVIMGMDAPQMQAVGGRLKDSGLEAEKLAGQYMAADEVEAAVATAKEQQIASLGGSSGLGPLMGKYKDLCKKVVLDPKSRLEYWAMVTM
ncbi:hypothetical protein L2735_14235 [Shewanella olleyana]|uniref:hypothetical protein n=1 Tax=Shewanella olleyana TaxID=135626 RepID=UPI00200D4C30|nr:hypothetical protein [Shewanella olleyana]MCL1067950.1 hypothetical protein [Shewanella olleyana]